MVVRVRTRLSYDEVRRLKTFEERFKYLEIGGHIGIESFGFDRY